ncbi:ATP-binding cassette domain-containing protein [Paenibacillus assamensis]|uniref:ATP-binding cassette domain-containing protein n=1 Tax=Paenibacillus assamensis TaxID=311244 RepID=UPI00041C342B|nr:ATP-binding cassette domain-containing protein [Paenibacillus assamensis]
MTTALNDIDLEIEEGEFVGIMGPSGSSKTTLLHLLATMDRPTSGSIEINGVNPLGLLDKELSLFRRRQLGFVFQEFNLVHTLSMKDVLLAPFIMVTVVVGTYFLFTQLSIYMLQLAQGNARFYYNRTNMIMIAQLAYKLKDNARMLFIVSILSAVMLTASGAVYTLLRSVQLDGAQTQYEDPEGLFALILFSGMFISLLFFIAAGSMIYFKLFTELREDQEQYNVLTRIGMTPDEIRKIIVAQLGIIFYVPCIVGIIHASFAMKAMDNVLQLAHWSYSFGVICIYIAMQTIYFLVTCHDYMNHVVHSNKSMRSRGGGYDH